MSQPLKCLCQNNLAKVSGREMKKYKEVGTPEGVAVYMNRDGFGNRIYYFSSHASSLAKDLLHTFKATRCIAEPHLDKFRKIRL